MSSRAGSFVASDPRLGALYVEKEELVGMETLTARKLVESLVGGPSVLPIVLLVGEGGIGKTNLAKNVCEVSQCYSQMSLLRSMIHKICVIPTQLITAK